MKVTLSNESENPDIVFDYFYFNDPSDESSIENDLYESYRELQELMEDPTYQIYPEDLDSHPYEELQSCEDLADYLLRDEPFSNSDDSDWLFSLKVEDGKPNLILHIEGAHAFDFCCIEVDQTFEHMENCREALEACDDATLERLAVFGGKAAEEWSSRKK